MQSLKETSNRQRNAYNKLEQVVSQGYDYYKKSYSEKKNILSKASLNSSQNLIENQRYLSLDGDISIEAPKNTKLK